MAGACACYIIDNGYLLPALVSAIQARGRLSREAADVVVVCLDEPTAHHRALSAVVEAHGIKLIYQPKSLIGDMHIMFARLIIHELLPEQYRRIIYIDGDTQIAGSLDPLVSAAIPPGHFLACRDPAVIFSKLSDSWRRRIKAQREAVGYQRPPADYFNSGVLVIDRQTWPPLSADCLAMVRQKGQQLRHPDQDILNLAIGDRCTLISNRWNFPGFLIGSSAETAVKPCIYHFMSNPRPWIEAVPPWGEAWARPYGLFLRQYPELAFLTPRRAPLRTLRYWVQQELKMAVEYRAVGKLAEPEPEMAL